MKYGRPSKGDMATARDLAREYFASSGSIAFSFPLKLDYHVHDGMILISLDELSGFRLTLLVRTPHCFRPHVGSIIQNDPKYSPRFPSAADEKQFPGFSLFDQFPQEKKGGAIRYAPCL